MSKELNANTVQLRKLDSADAFGAKNFHWSKVTSGHAETTRQLPTSTAAPPIYGKMGTTYTTESSDEPKDKVSF
jgi:hypothetical protein